MSPSFRAILFDLSGVLYEGSQPVQGAADVIRKARDLHYTLRFVTNTASKSSTTVLKDLVKMGIPLQPNELYTAPRAAKEYILSHKIRPYCLIHQNLQSEFADLPQSDPNCVLLGDARDDLNYGSLNRAFRLCKQGAPLIGIGLNKYFKDEDGLKLDAGAFIRALEWAADIDAIIMGKPSPHFFKEVVTSTGHDANQCLMIGDDVIADVQGAIDSGLRGCLVRTGKYQKNDENKLSNPENTLVLDSVSELPL